MRSNLTKDEIVKLAAQGVSLPDGLDPADSYLFFAMRYLYGSAKIGQIGKEQGQVEKRIILQLHERMKLYIKVVEEHRRKEREFEGAWEAFAKEPSIENADRLHKAWYGCGLKIAVETEDAE